MVLLRSLLSLRPIVAHRNCFTSRHLHKFSGSWWCVAQRIFRREHGFCSHKHCPVIIHKKCSCTHNVMCSQVGTGIKRKFSSEATLASNTKLWRYLESLVNEYQELTEKLALPYELNEREITAINQKMAALDFLVSKVKEYKEGLKSLDDLKMLVADAGQSDRDMVKLAELEKHQYEAQLLYIEKEIHLHLLPPEKGDHTDIILEVTAGVGGQEAMLFTDEIFHMYANYAAMKGWGFEVIDSEATDMGGLRRASASISGQVVYKHLKYEAGVHRVQRVPRTEKAGRMHTSTMTVAVLPQPTEIDIVINPKDLRIDTFRSSGKGGQHVNTTDSAVRIVHLPTGIVAECQAGRSQIQNKATAMAVLRSRLYERELEQQMKDQKSQRKLQVGSAGRSEKIRTYNFNQDRITDHRIGKNLYSVDDFLSGGEQLEEIINLLQEESRRERLMEILEQFTKRTEQQKS